MAAKPNANFFFSLFLHNSSLKNVPSLILLIISCLAAFLGACDNGVIFFLLWIRLVL